MSGDGQTFPPNVRGIHLRRLWPDIGARTPEDGGNVCPSPLMELFAAALCQSSPVIYRPRGHREGKGVTIKKVTVTAFPVLHRHYPVCGAAKGDKLGFLLRVALV